MAGMAEDDEAPGLGIEHVDVCPRSAKILEIREILQKFHSFLSEAETQINQVFLKNDDELQVLEEMRQVVEVDPLPQGDRYSASYLSMLEGQLGFFSNLLNTSEAALSEAEREANFLTTIVKMLSSACKKWNLLIPRCAECPNRSTPRIFFKIKTTFVLKFENKEAALGSVAVRTDLRVPIALGCLASSYFSRDHQVTEVQESEWVKTEKYDKRIRFPDSTLPVTKGAITMRKYIDAGDCRRAGGNFKFWLHTPRDNPEDEVVIAHLTAGIDILKAISSMDLTVEKLHFSAC